MKKTFIFSLLVIAVLNCFSQNVAKVQKADSKRFISDKYLNAKKLDRPILPPSLGSVLSSSSRPKKSRANGVYYERPKGLWYSAYGFGADGNMTALHCPALVDLTFVNACNNPSAATWTLNGTDITLNADEDNNLPWGPYSGISESNEGDYNASYAPTINYKGDSFSITDLMLISGSTSPICDYNPSLSESYSGFSDGPAWGTGSVLEAAIQEQMESEGGSVGGFLGYRKDFEKPISPMYVTSISMPMMSNQQDFLGGKALTIKVYELVEKTDEEGNTYMGLGDLKDSLTCSSIDSEYNMSLNGYYASDVQFSKTVTNDFGELEAPPITIDYPFSLVISGFNQEGVDAELFLLDGSADDYEFDNAYPTRILTQVGDEVYGYYWKGTSSSGNYMYAFPIYFNALYDNVFVATQASSQDGTETYDNLNYVEVSTDGKTCKNYLYGSDYPGAIVSTATPWNDGSDDNYYAEYPEWITGMSATETDAENNPGNYVVSFKADPLPEGVTGRGAYLYIVGRGVVSEDSIFVYQGDINAALGYAVQDRLATGISLDKTSLNLEIGKTTTITATVLSNYALNKKVSWSSSDENVATVKDGVVTALKEGTAVITATTTDGSNLSASCTITVYSTLVKGITLDKTSVEMQAEESVTLTVTITPDYAVNKNVLWSSSDESVATVKDGVVTAVKVGSAVITATTTDGTNLKANCDVTVKTTIAQGITLDKTSLGVKVGDTGTIEATVTPTNTTNKSVTWSSSDENVATVKDGVVTALKEGTAIITATTTDGSNLSASCTITVYSTLVKGITLDKTSVEMQAEESVTLTVTITPDYAVNKNVLWSSSDESVATVKDGVVTAVKVGSAVITATTTDGTNLKAICNVTVKTTIAQCITLDKISLGINVGDTETIVATVTPTNTTNKSVTWSSSDENVATVKDGIVTAFKAGTAIITAETTDGSNLKAICNVTVSNVLASEIILSQTSADVVLGSQITLKAVVSPVNTTDKTIVWSSDNETIATVKDGVVSAFNIGKVNITAATTDGSDLKATCLVNVIPKYVESLTISSADLVMNVYDEADLSVVVNPSDATYQDVIWKSSDESVATVNQGHVVALKPGEATISVRATDGSNAIAYCNVTVEQVYVNSITFEKSSVSIAKGETVQLNPTITPENATYPELEWTSSDNTIATVDKGLVSAIEEGAIIITAKSTDGGNVTSQCIVIVTPQSGIMDVRIMENVEGVYTLDGKKVEKIHQGVYLIRMKDGNVKKITINKK